jgi:ABC-2 type transport system permease protein
MKETLKLYWMAFNTALQAKFEYRVDFILGIITACMRQLSSLAFLWIIFHQIPDINGWTRFQIILLFGMVGAALGLSELFFNHIWMVPGYIVMGDLDRLLTYPVNSLYFLLVTRPELHSFGNLATGLTLASIALYRLQAPWYAWVLAPFLIILGCVIYTAALVIFASLSFKFIGPTSLHLMIPNTMLQATGYPLSIFPGWLQFLLLFLLPYGAFHYLPASLLLNKALNPWFYLTVPLATLFFIWVAQRIWLWGLNKYESTGS